MTEKKTRDSFLSILTKPVFFLGLILFVLVLVFYFKRGIFFERYDPPYWKDRFEHSQWYLPVSRRTMGDDAIYAYGGYQLLQGASIEETRTNKPPVVIYLFGLSILLFQNPVVASYLFGVATLLIFYLLCKEFLKSEFFRLASVATLAVSPMFLSQMYLTLLDLPQTTFLLTSIYFFVLAVRRSTKQLVFILLSGLTLGLFVETKPPVLLPLIILLEGGYLLYLRRFKLIGLAIIGFAFGVLLPYFRYFLTGHSILDYFKLHKYMASIYYEGSNEVYRLGLVQSMLFGMFPDVSTGKLTPFRDFWIGLPIIFLGSLFEIVKTLLSKKSDIVLKGIGISVVLTFLFFSNVSSYPRYLIIILPFMIMFLFIFLEKYADKLLIKLFVLLFLLIGSVNLFFYLPSQPSEMLDRAYSNIGNKLFHDLYKEQVSTSSLPYSEKDFRLLGLNTFYDAEIEHISYKEIDRSIYQIKGSGYVQVEATYVTKNLGEFKENKKIDLIRENGEWKIVWHDNLIVNGYSPGYSFENFIENGSRGSIILNGNVIFAQDEQGVLISVDPQKIDKTREEEMLDYIEEVSKKNKAALLNAYIENPHPGKIVPLATNFVKLTINQIDRLKQFPGVILSKYPTRIYRDHESSYTIGNAQFDECCTRIYSVTNYRGNDGLEKLHDKTLSGNNGGKLILLDEQKRPKRTLIDSDVKHGRDVVIR